jgi:hypothetical protein
MQLLGIFILLGLLILFFLAAMYFARGQTSHRTPYDSWSAMLGPRNGAGRVMDANERVLHEIGSAQGRHRHRKRSH